MALSNTLSAVFLLDQAEEKQQFIDKLNKLMDIIKQLTEEDQQRFFTWMSNRLRYQEIGIDPEYIVKQIFNVKKGVDGNMGFEKVFIDAKLEGKRAAQEKIAKQMIAENFDNEIIAKLTGCTVEQLENLRKSTQ